jgi:hypothetical protein
MSLDGVCYLHSAAAGRPGQIINQVQVVLFALLQQTRAAEDSTRDCQPLQSLVCLLPLTSSIAKDSRLREIEPFSKVTELMSDRPGTET